MSELFTIPEALSPRLAWIKKHGIQIIDSGPTWQPGDECPETGATLYRFCAHNDLPGAKIFFDHLTGWGDTEDDAVLEFARKHSLRLWNEPEPLRP